MEIERRGSDANSPTKSLGREYTTEGLMAIVRMSKDLTSFTRLSRRQMQVTQRVALGKPNKVIAADLKLSEGTVKAYMGTIFEKTGAENRTELAILYTLYVSILRKNSTNPNPE